jgi:polyisoprenoid-binding protein YceI
MKNNYSKPDIHSTLILATSRASTFISKMRIVLYFMILGCVLLQKRPEIDLEKAEISFLFVDKDVDGTIGGLQSESKIDTDNLEKSVLKGSAAVNTLDTDNFLRDGHLMWKKYFHEDKYPRIEFESTSITRQGNGYVIKANLKIKGIMQEESFTATRTGDKIKINGSINTADYGIEIKNDYQENKLKVEMVFQLRK